MDGLVSAMGTSPRLKLILPSVTDAAGGFVLINGTAGSSFGQLATPTAYSSGGTTYNNSSSPIAGFPQWSAAGGSLLTYLASAQYAGSIVGTLHIYDMLWAASGMSGTVATAQSISSFSGLPSRNSTGVGTEIWLIDWNSALGATASNATCSYSNTTPTSGRTTVSTAMIASMPAYRMLNLPLQSGDLGVSTIASVTLSSTTGTAGNFGPAIVQRVASLPIPQAYASQGMDFSALNLPNITDNCSMAFVFESSTTSSGIILATLGLAQG